MGEETEVKNGDFMTPEEAQSKLRSLGYKEDLILVPKGSHFLTALYNIASSKNGGSLREEVANLHAADPRHQRQLNNFGKIPSVSDKTNKPPTIFNTMKALKT